MPVLTEFTSKTLSSLRPQIDAELIALGKKLGIEFKAGNASCSGTSATFKLEMSLVGDTAGKSAEEIEDIKLRNQFNEYAKLFNLTPDDFCRELIVNGEKFELVGFKPRAAKSYLGRRVSDRKVYAFDSDYVRRQFDDADKKRNKNV